MFCEVHQLVLNWFTKLFFRRWRRRNAAPEDSGRPVSAKSRPIEMPRPNANVCLLLRVGLWSQGLSSQTVHKKCLVSEWPTEESELWNAHVEVFLELSPIRLLPRSKTTGESQILVLPVSVRRASRHFLVQMVFRNVQMWTKWKLYFHSSFVSVCQDKVWKLCRNDQSPDVGALTLIICWISLNFGWSLSPTNCNNIASLVVTIAPACRNRCNRNFIPSLCWILFGEEHHSTYLNSCFNAQKNKPQMQTFCPSDCETTWRQQSREHHNLFPTGQSRSAARKRAPESGTLFWKDFFSQVGFTGLAMSPTFCNSGTLVNLWFCENSAPGQADAAVRTSMPNSTTCWSCPSHKVNNLCATSSTSMLNLVLGTTHVACPMSSSSTVLPKPLGYWKHFQWTSKTCNITKVQVNDKKVRFLFMVSKKKIVVGQPVQWRPTESPKFSTRQSEKDHWTSQVAALGQRRHRGRGKHPVPRQADFMQLLLRFKEPQSGTLTQARRWKFPSSVRANATSEKNVHTWKRNEVLGLTILLATVTISAKQQIAGRNLSCMSQRKKAVFEAFKFPKTRKEAIVALVCTNIRSHMIGCPNFRDAKQWLLYMCFAVWFF